MIQQLADDAMAGDAETVRRLLASLMLASDYTNEGWTALLRAVANGRVETARMLLRAGAEADARTGDAGSAIIEQVMIRSYLAQEVGREVAAVGRPNALTANVEPSPTLARRLRGRSDRQPVFYHCILNRQSALGQDANQD